jgi:hypothetical protein
MNRRAELAAAWVIVTAPFWGTAIVDAFFWRAWRPVPQVLTALVAFVLFLVVFIVAVDALNRALERMK